MMLRNSTVSNMLTVWAKNMKQGNETEEYIFVVDNSGKVADTTTIILKK